MKLRDKMGLAEKQGDVGIEIEVEGYGLPCAPVGWMGEHDGSLRGEAIEYVLKKPCARDKVEMYLDRLIDAAEGVEILDTGYAGVHIHINVQELNLTQVVNMICLYLIYEESLIRYCGAEREGNLFCLRNKDAQYLVDSVRTIMRDDKWHKFDSDRLRYAAMNLKALATYGSIEFRAMRSTMDKGVLMPWVNALLRLRDYAQKFSSPIKIVEAASGQGLDYLFEEIFGDTPIQYDEDGAWRGVRHAQLIAYARRDWEEYGSHDENSREHWVKLVGDRVHRAYNFREKVQEWLSSDEAWDRADKGDPATYCKHYLNWMNHEGVGPRWRVAEVFDRIGGLANALDLEEVPDEE